MGVPRGRGPDHRREGELSEGFLTQEGAVRWGRGQVERTARENI